MQHDMRDWVLLSILSIFCPSSEDCLLAPARCSLGKEDASATTMIDLEGWTSPEGLSWSDLANKQPGTGGLAKGFMSVRVSE